MALQANELVTSVGTRPTGLRAFGQEIRPKKFGAGTGTLTRLTPVAFNTNTNTWVVWTNGGANGTGTISGFVWPDDVVLAAGGEVLGQVMLRGQIHVDDIPTPAGEVRNNLLAVLKTQCRALGIQLDGLIDVR